LTWKLLSIIIKKLYHKLEVRSRGDSLKIKLKAAVLVVLLLAFEGMSSGRTRVATVFIDPMLVPLAGAAGFTIPVPSAPGTAAKRNDKAIIDYSNAKDGYVMVKYTQNTRKALRVIIKGPSGVSYTYVLKPGNFEVFPFSDGNGSYTVGVYEQIEGTKYSVANTATISVRLENEFAPFLTPNQYVNFSKDSIVVQKAAELTSGSTSFIDKISAIYNFVINNFTYDKELARTVQSGYLPDVDAVMRKRKGICFDYSAVMTAMLRSLGIPCKLVVGYAGDVYHAWINAYSHETGWINQVIFFDGRSWRLMDPTFASSSKQSSEIMRFIGDGGNYKSKFMY